jgi:hypothetical protein
MKSNYKFKGIKIDTLLLIPSFTDTTSANSTYLDQVAGSMIRCGNDFWMRNASATAWLQNVNVGPGTSPVMDFVNEVFKKSGTDSVYYVVSPSDTFFAFKDVGYDTTSLSLRIDQKIDSIKRRSDSVYFKKNGGWFFAFKDSTGGTQNFANTNLTATGNRTHNFRNKFLVIDSTSYTQIYAKEGAPNFRIGTLSLLPFEGGITSQNTSGDQTGFYYDMQNNNVALINKNNFAWLSKRLFLEDTIAMLSDITGGGSNFANADLTATGNRSHNFKGYTLDIDSTSEINLYTRVGFDENRLNLGDKYGQFRTIAGGKYFGFNYDADSKNVTIMNNSNTAYMTKRAFGTDTIALRSDILQDSPDRIDGTATKNITADMNSFDLVVNDASKIELNTNSVGTFFHVNGSDKVIRSKADTFLISGLPRLSDLSNGIVIADVDGNLAINQKNWYGDNNVDLTSSDYTATNPGVYTVQVGDVNNAQFFNLPSPGDCLGRSITIFNTDGTYNVPLTTPSGNIYEDASGTTLTTISQGKSITLMSDGTNWRSTFKN